MKAISKNIAVIACALLTSVAQLHAADQQKRVVLTFDDACKSHATVVAPLLKKHGFNATFFISEGFSFTSRKDIYMTWGQIKKLHDQGFEIGNHTQSHVSMKTLSEKAIHADLEHIEKQCEKHGIPKPTTFAYPGYITSETAVKVLKARGYTFARTGGAKASRPGKDDPLLLPDSLCPTPKTTFDELKKAADQANDRHIPIFTFHGVPDAEHGWVSTNPKTFERFMQYLKDNGFKAIALRDYPAKKATTEKKPQPAPPAAPLRTNKNRGGRQILPPNSKLLQVAGHTGFVALPKNVEAGKKTPWLWSVPVAGNLPGKLEKWMMDQCLANGIAVAGIDLGGDFGTPAGRAAMTAFHQEVTQNHGLTKKACMLARSYGGLQMYNWAAEHPESVACLAGIYPVCNMASYPGLKSAAGKYRMPQEQFVKELKKHNPIDRLAPLAKAKVPIYHNTGDVDKLVPGKDNSFLLAERYKALGGDITVTVFKGQGHNYWTGFFEDKAMAAFIIKHAKGVARLPKVLIVGDSISGGYSKPLIKLMDGKAEMVRLGAVATYRIHKEAFWHSSGTAKALDFGSVKACIADFERFERHLSETQYDVIHFNFGLNDSFRGRKGRWHNPVEQYEKDLAKIVGLLKKNGAKIIWASTTPIPMNDPHRPVGDDLIYNAAAEKVMKANNIPINDLHSVITNWDGYAEWKKGNDVHFSSAVYAMLAEQIAKKIAKQLGSPGEAAK